MSFSTTFTAKSKDEAINTLHSQGLPQSVQAFIAAAIEGYSEPGGNHAVSDDKTMSGLAKVPVAIKVEASGHLDTAGGGSTCSISVSKA